jgi:hypothetical protein
MLTGSGRSSGTTSSLPPSVPLEHTSRLERHSTRLLIAVPLAMLLVVVTRTRSDPDLWGHVLFGRNIAAARTVPAADPYSFASDRPWINHEWLAELLMHGAFAAGGTSGLVALKALVVLGMLAVVLHAFERERPPPMLRHAVLWLAVFGTLARTISVRPQIFSVLLFAVLLHLLTDADQGRVRRIWFVPLVMALWVNLHGGWILGLATLIAWVAFRAWWTGAAGTRLALLTVVGASGFATLANPYGIGLWRFLAETVGFARPDILDWSPITRFPVAVGIPWALFVLLGGWALWTSPHRRSPAYIGIVLVLAAGTARVNRLDAFFALSVLILLAPQIVDAWRRRSGLEVSNQAAREVPPPTRRTLVTIGLTGVACLVAGGWMMADNLRCISMTGPWLPEREAARFLTANRFAGRMITWFDWGEYAIWHLAPSVSVSMDGRRETVYSQSWIDDQTAFYTGQTQARDLPIRVNADYIWLPRRLPVVDTLIAAGWNPVFAGSISTVLSRQPVAVIETPTEVVSARCFPGP